MIFPKKKSLGHTFLILGLVGCLLLVGSMLASQSVAHSLHHAHHKATTHASVICSWLCAAGQVVEADNPILESPLYTLRHLESLPPHPIRTVSPLFIFERGPPLSFL